MPRNQAAEGEILDLIVLLAPILVAISRQLDNTIAETCAKEGIMPGTLTLHADRGNAMTSKCVAHLLADLGVELT